MAALEPEFGCQAPEKCGRSRRVHVTLAKNDTRSHCGLCQDHETGEILSQERAPEHHPGGVEDLRSYAAKLAQAHGVGWLSEGPWLLGSAGDEVENGLHEQADD